MLLQYALKQKKQQQQNKNALALPDTVPVIEDRVGLIISHLPIFLLYQGICQWRRPQLEALGCC